MNKENRCLAEALAAFPYEEKIVAMEPFGSGHINDTYALYAGSSASPRLAYILQRLNTNVFKKPEDVMQNIVGVTEYLRERLEAEGEDAARGTLHFLKTFEGKPAYYDIEGMPWRSYHYIEDSFCYEKSPTVEVFYESARAFGDFLNKLQNYPAETLHETIPHFHDTPRRLEALRQAAEADRLGRAAGCRREIEFALARAEDCGLLVNLLQKGELPLRVTHNDTKLNNILFDKKTGKAVCVIDLDTIMPGLSLNDYGDSIRFGATTAAEDERDLSKVALSLDLFEAYTRGYLETAGGALTPREKELLPQGARLITLECGMRFLTDYLEGDSYFKIERPGQNLDRCRTQFKLVQDMEDNLLLLQEIAAKYAGG
ncbi:MAG: phosphotransferase enzyme family protein [Oscillospiraceae bacterium]